MNIIIDFLKNTSWRMDQWKPYEKEHLILLVIGISTAVYFAIKLRNISEKENRVLLAILSVYFVLTEIYKELFLSYIIEDGYCWSDFPFQLCSIGMYLCVVAVFFKKKEITEVIYCFLGTYNFMGGIAAFLEPESMFYSYVTMTIHSILWHYLLIFIGLYSIISGRVKYNLRVFSKTIFLYLILCIVAYILNAIFMNMSQNEMNLFFIGPGKSDVIILEDISNKYGSTIETIVFTIASTIGAAIIYIITFLLRVSTVQLYCKKLK